jgi:hypothetical protein
MDNPIIIVLFVLIALLFGFFIVRSTSATKEKRRVPNYKALFIIGVTWLPIGVATDNPGLWIMGLLFMIVGASNKSKWGQETKWADLAPNEKRIKLLFVGGLTIVLLALLLFYIFTKGN